MFENMVGVVGLAMHEDRLAQATKNMRRVEAKKGQRAGASGGYRTVVATALNALAARITSPATLSGKYTQAPGR